MTEADLAALAVVPFDPPAAAPVDEA